MVKRKASPKTIHKQIRKLKPGVELKLAEGNYIDPIVISDVSGTEDNPIIIRGAKPRAPGKKTVPRSPTIFQSADTLETFSRRANALARVSEESKGFPGIHYIADNAQVILRNCQWVILEDLTFDNCWPTAIYINTCQHIVLRHLHFRAGTFAIGAEGAHTRHLLIENCDWIQDTSCGGDIDLHSIRKKGRLPKGRDTAECLLWKQTNWLRVHGGKGETKRDVSLDDDVRALDGDFFRAWTIAGNVILRNNCVLDAFNGIHFYNQSSADTQSRHSRNVLIENNWFVRLRDNAVEPEDYVWNWTVRHNKFADCYAPFSIEPERSGYIYIYGNLGWNFSRPGPDDDVRISGRLFKFGTQHEAVGPHYVVHNTWILRGPIFKKKRIVNFKHMFNVIGYYEDAELFSHERAHPFGREWYLEHDPQAEWKDAKAVEKKRFTKFWDALDITVAGDMVGHPAYPDQLRLSGYPIGENASGETPEFRNKNVGDPDGLHVANADRAKVLKLEWPDKTEHKTDVGGAKPLVGAWQGDTLFTLPDPAFVRYWDRGSENDIA